MARSSDHHFLIAEFGKSIGVEGVAFNDQDELRLYIDEDIIDLRYEKEKSLLTLIAALGTPLIGNNSEFYPNVLELNLVGILSGGGSVGLNRADNKLIYADSLPISETDTDDFNDFIARSLALVRTWKNLLSSGEILKAHESETLLAG